MPAVSVSRGAKNPSKNLGRVLSLQLHVRRGGAFNSSEIMVVLRRSLVPATVSAESGPTDMPLNFCLFLQGQASPDGLATIIANDLKRACSMRTSTLRTQVCISTFFGMNRPGRCRTKMGSLKSHLSQAANLCFRLMLAGIRSCTWGVFT